MKKKTCKLCNRTYSHKYNLFGRGCFDTERRLLHVRIPKEEKNKEKYLCDVIAKRLHKYGLSQSKKYELATKYLTLEYINNIEYGDLSEEKEQLQKEIDDISITKVIKDTVDLLLDNDVNNYINDSLKSLTLNKVYRLFKTTQKFNEAVRKFKNDIFNSKNEEQRIAILERLLLDDLKFVFDSSKLSLPLTYKIYYGMQVAVWKIVISTGALIGLKLSAELLQKALIADSKNEEDYYITNSIRIKELKDNIIIQKKINELIEKYSKNKSSIDLNENNIDVNELKLSFEENDLFFSLHDATINIKGKKEDNKWQLEVTIKDEYDFTNPNLSLKEYKNNALGCILNNCGVVSQQYGVLRPYYVYAIFKYEV